MTYHFSCSPLHTSNGAMIDRNGENLRVQGQLIVSVILAFLGVGGKAVDYLWLEMGTGKGILPGYSMTINNLFLKR